MPSSLIEPPFNYTGSKYKLLPQILPLFDYSRRTFVDLFTGGGSVYVNVLDRFDKILINDVIVDLIGIHKAMALDAEELETQTRTILSGIHDRASYEKVRAEYNQSPSPAGLFALMLSCTNNMLRFNKSFKFNQTYGERSWNQRTSEKMAAFQREAGKHKDKITYSSQRFHEVKIPEGSFVYIDPPYSNSFAGYNCYWEPNDEQRLLSFILECGKDSSVCVSGTLVHDGKSNSLLQSLISAGWKKVDVRCDYNKVSRVGAKDVQEVVVANYQPQPDKDEYSLFP